MKYDSTFIEISNWDKYNPRKNLKASSWFRFQNNFLEHEDFIDFTDGELLSVVYLMSQCSKKQTGRIKISYRHAEQIGRRKQADLESALEKLLVLGFLRVTTHACNTHDTRTTHACNATDEQTDETDVTDETDETPQSLDFDSVWSAYPRKTNKTEGKDRFERLIKSEQDFFDLRRAVDNYAAYVLKAGTEEKFIKHFSSFLGIPKKQIWRDWITPEQSNIVPQASSRATQRQNANQATLEQYAAMIGGGNE